MQECPRPTIRPRPAFTILAPALAALILATAGCDTGEDEPAPRPIASGNANNLCLAVVSRSGEDAGLRWWQQSAHTDVWRTGSPLDGRVVAATAYRERLFVFFSEGRYGLVGSGRPDIHPAPLPRLAPVAAEADGLALDAYGWVGDELTYLRMAGDAWTSAETGLPLDPGDVREPQAARFGERPYLFWRTPRTGDPLVMGDAMAFARRGADGAWGRYSTRVRLLPGYSVAAVGETMVCLYRRPGKGDAGGTWTLDRFSPGDDNFYRLAAFEDLDPERPLRVARRGGGLVIAAAGSPPEVAPIEVGADAALLGEFEPVAPKGGFAEEEAPTWQSQDTVMVIVLAGLVVLLALRGGASRQPTGDAETAPTPAPLLQRGVAAAIDHLLVSMVAGTLIIVLLPDFVSAVQTGQVPPVERLLLAQAITHGVLFAYYTLAEGLTGRSLGKHFLGLEVRQASGKRLTLRRALVRNLLRPVDWFPMFYFIGLISIFIGPYPQRVGDRVARTIVVRRSR